MSIEKEVGTLKINPPTLLAEPKPGDGVPQMLIAVVLFSFGHAAVKWVPHIPFYQLVFLRASITALICLVILRVKGISWRGRNLKLLFLRGLFGTVALTCYFYSLQNMPLASAVTIQYLSPVLTLIFAAFLLREKGSRKQAWGFFVAFAGVLMVKGFDSRVSLTAFVVSIVSVTASAVAYNLVRMLKDFDHELVVVLYFPLVTIPIVGPFALRDWVSPSPKDWIFIAVIGIFTQLAQVFMTMAYHRRKASDVAIYNYLGVLIALAIGFFYFHEAFSPLNLVGMAVIMLAVVFLR